MKSKPLVYLLGFLVLCIWGVIVYRIYISVHEVEGGQGTGTSTAMPQKLKLPKLYPDTFPLLLDYPDPFTGAVVKEPDTAKRVPVKKSMVTVPPLQVPVNPVTQMKYLGFVSDGKGDNRVAIVGYQGSEKMLKEGDTLQKVKVMAIQKNTLVLQYKGKNTTIKTE